MRLLIGLLAALAIALGLTQLRSSDGGPSPAAAQQSVDQQREAVDGINRAVQAREAAQ